jgi:hypothetical protein
LRQRNGSTDVKLEMKDETMCKDLEKDECREFLKGSHGVRKGTNGAMSPRQATLFHAPRSQ